MPQPPAPAEPVRQDLSPDAVVDAIEDNAVASVRSWSAWPEIELHEEPGLIWTMSDVPSPLFNCVVRPRLTAETADGAIAASTVRATRRRVPVSWWLGPAPTPADLETRLEGAGFRRGEALVGMGVDLSRVADAPTRPAGLTVVEATDGDRFRRWCFLLGPCFDLPPQTLAAWRRCFEAVGYGPGTSWRHLLALRGDTPVATASLFFGAGVAAIANVGTAEDLRGRGFGQALSAHALTLAHSAGFRIGTLWASHQGVPLYRRLGFRPFCRGPVFLWAP